MPEPTEGRNMSEEAADQEETAAVEEETPGDNGADSKGYTNLNSKGWENCRA